LLGDSLVFTFLWAGISSKYSGGQKDFTIVIVAIIIISVMPGVIAYVRQKMITRQNIA
jgi:hypothetical protein